jgi:hypothetical protein
MVTLFSQTLMTHSSFLSTITADNVTHHGWADSEGLEQLEQANLHKTHTTTIVSARTQ